MIAATSATSAAPTAVGAQSFDVDGSARPTGWRDLTRDLITRIASYAHPNDVSGGLKLLNVETASCLRGYRRLGLAAPPLPWPGHDLPPRAQQPWPGDAFLRHWSKPEPWRALNLRERRRLLYLAASSGHAASLAAAVAHCGCALDVHALESAAAVGDVEACDTLVKAGCEWGQSALAAAAATGHLPVCSYLWAAGLRPAPVRNNRSAVVEAACRGGHMHVFDWLEEVGYIRVLAPAEPPPAPTPPAPPPSPAARAASVSAGITKRAASTRASAPSTDARRSAAREAPPYLHAFAALMAASRGHTALLHRLLRFGRGRHSDMTEDDDASRGCDDVGRQLDGVAGPHRQGLLLAYASGCTAEEFEAVYDEYLQYEWGRGNGGLALGELCSALLQRAASSLRPDGSWALKVDLVLARLRERMGGVDAAAAVGRGAGAGTGGGAGAGAGVLLRAAGAGWEPGPGVGEEGSWSVWVGAAEHWHPEEVERRMRFLVSRGLQPSPGALRAAAARGSVGAVVFLLNEYGLQLTPALSEEAARCGRLAVIRALPAWHDLPHNDEMHRRLVSSALAGVRRANLAGAGDVNYGCVYGCGCSPQQGTGTEVTQVLRRLVLDRVAEAGGSCGGRGGGGGGSGGGEGEGAGGGRANGSGKGGGDSSLSEPGLHGGVGQDGGTISLPPWAPSPPRYQSAEHWLHMFEEACGSGVSDTAILAQLLSWAGLSGPVQPAAAGAAAAGAAADEEEDDCRVLTVTRVVNSMLAAGSETAVLWAARRLRELGCHPGPPLTLLQLWAAALGGNFAAVRAACAAGLGRMPDWLPDCAYQVGRQPTGHVVWALRFLLDEPGCRGAPSWRKLWRRLRAAQEGRVRELQLTPAQVDWLRRRQERQAQARGRAARQAAGRMLCGVGDVLRRVCGVRGADGSSFEDGGDSDEEDSK